MSVHDSPAAWRKQRLWPQGNPAPRRGDPGAGPVDDSLTNLQWLLEFSIRTSDPETPSTSVPLGHRSALRDSDAPASPRTVDAAAAGMRLCTGEPGSGSSGPVLPLPPTPDTVDYRTNAQVKPPHSYVTLIRMAMQASRGAKVPLSAIYAWIMDNFCYYRQADPSWQNSIRHNLSLNKCFRKVPRRKDEPGKGGFWQVDPQYADPFAGGACRRGRPPRLPSLAPGTCEPACSHGPGQGPLPPRGPGPQWPGPPHRLGTCRQPSAPGTGASAWTAPALPVGPASREPELSWASALEDSLASGSGSDSLEDLELTAALGALATGEGALGALGKGGAGGADRALCAGPWEGESAGPAAGPAWAFEGGPCLAEGFLAEMQPWEG